ncbi:unnamed protein product [Lasius platythorax]|uniref:Uncharacterized protein n=1 Tax=Lasius platythorax TaxID=488582 RepID=A0AAV2N382_9HYME
MGNAHVEAVTNPPLVLSCYVARRLDILRSARIPCRAITRSNDRVGIFTFQETGEGPKSIPKSPAYEVIPSTRRFDDANLKMILVLPFRDLPFKRRARVQNRFQNLRFTR